MKIILKSAADQEALGQSLAHALPKQCLMFLSGDLGAGKTTLVRGILRGMGHQGTVKSPTYTLVEPYELQDRWVFHFDLYRLEHPDELENIGIEDYLAEEAIVLIEWPERVPGRLPMPDLHGVIHFCPEGRMLDLQAATPKGEAVLQHFNPNAPSSNNH